MGTNPQAEGQTKISFQISEKDKEKLRKLADASGMKLSEYLRRVIDSALSDETQFRTVKSHSVLLVAESPQSYPFGKDPSLH